VRFTVLTIFPEMFSSYMGESIIGRALARGLATVELLHIRDFTDDRHRTVDDLPYGGGAGLLMKPEPIARAIESVGPVDARVLLTPSGRLFRQADAARWSKLESVVLVCGRYEGIDDRVRERYIDEEISIGDYVLTGGELAAMVAMDATIRLLPGTLGNEESAQHESFTEPLLEHPHYTRPAVWRGIEVPPVLLSGHHAEIDRWRHEASIRRTARNRPDLLEPARLEPAELALARAVNPEISIHPAVAPAVSEEE